jgi:hypothetical protein
MNTILADSTQTRKHQLPKRTGLQWCYAMLDQAQQHKHRAIERQLSALIARQETGQRRLAI